MKRIHIVGVSPRTGTTLLAELMIACFEIDLHTDHEDPLFASPALEGEVYLTKRPRDIMVVGPRLHVDPDLYAVCMIRDPRDIVVSRHGRNPDRYWAGLNFWKTYEPAARRLAAHPRFVTVRYEDLVSDPDGIQRLLAARMPFLRQRARFSDFHELAKPSHDSLLALGGVRPIDTSGIGAWERHLPRVAGQLLRHGSIAGDLIRYGYETDDAWLHRLDGIEPDSRPSFQKEEFTLLAHWKLRRGKYLEVLRTLLRRVVRR